MIVAVEPRPLTRREREVLDALLGVEFEGVETLRREAVAVVGVCGCGCPSVDFQRGRGMTVRVNASVRATHDGLFLYTVEDPRRGEVLGGIEWESVGDTVPAEFPPPARLDIRPA